jgi:hypothetical protein
MLAACGQSATLPPSASAATTTDTALGSTISGSRISSRSRVLALGLVPKVLRMRSPVTRNLKVSHVSLVTLLHPVGPPVRRIVRPHPENDRQHKNNHADDLQR